MRCFDTECCGYSSPSVLNLRNSIMSDSSGRENSGDERTNMYDDKEKKDIIQLRLMNRFKELNKLSLRTTVWQFISCHRISLKLLEPLYNGSFRQLLPPNWISISTVARWAHKQLTGSFQKNKNKEWSQRWCKCWNQETIQGMIVAS